MQSWNVAAALFREQPASRRRAWTLLLGAAAAWAAVAWAAVGRYEDGLTDSYLRRERAASVTELRAIADGFEQSRQMVEGLLTTLARQDWLLAALPPGGKGDPDEVSRSLLAVVSDVKSISGLSLFDANGDCIGASLAATEPSLIGRNFADRAYFAANRRGLTGSALVIGRTTPQPGLVVSVPLSRGGHFAGALAARVNHGNLAPWLDFAPSFIADDNGVVVLSRDQPLLFTLLPGRSLDHLDGKQRQALYQRGDLPPLPATAWAPTLHPDVKTLLDRPTPVLLLTAPLAGGVGVVGVLHPVPRLLLLQRDRPRMFALVLALGILLMLVFFHLLQRLRDSLQRRRRAESDVAFHQSVIDAAAFAVAVFAEDGHCLAANDALVRLFATTREQMAQQNFRDDPLWQQSGLEVAARRVMRLGTVQRGHWRLSGADGGEIWVEATFRRFSYQTRPFLLTVFIDISEQQRQDGLLSAP